ncbi:hypothetical protein BDR26DRAFT_849535 [Obelidium mucronatum]|nr:hypothetical protein BDR26DRAFT_849535 [Obelidium mucronatum]
MSMMETPLIDLEAHFWEMENPDLLPTLDDWFLVFRVSTLERSMAPIHFSYDGDAFLSTFFQQPPMLRLIICAISAHYAPLPPETTFKYYTRARKAFVRAESSKSTYKTVQALYNICQFIQTRGQPHLMKPFLQAAINLIVHLQLDIDPNDSPWLFHLNLSARQKEDRRRAFWAVYLLMVEYKATDTAEDGVSQTLTCHKINPPSAVHIPYPVFNEHAQVLQVNQLFELLGAIRVRYSNPPPRITDIITPGLIEPMKTSLVSIHTALPANSILLIPSTETLTTNDMDSIATRLSQIPLENSFTTITITLLSQASLCVFHRPQLYLTCVPAFHPDKLDTEQREIIQNAVSTCFDSALRIINLYSFFAGIASSVTTNDEETPPPPPPPHWFHQSPQLSGFYALFESVLVLWFIICRMDLSWTSVTRVGQREEKDWTSLSRRMRWIIRYMKDSVDLFGMNDGAFTPLLVCMEGMMKEVQYAGYFENLVVCMKVVDLGGGGSAMVAESETVKEPHAFLGLLGLEVAGGIRWHGSSEGRWRQFWGKL